MRKIKKINGYLVVKFNDREINEWKGTGLGNYGVIDAESYTGFLDLDRHIMEFDSAETLAEAVKQAHGLNSEFDMDEQLSIYSIIKETGNEVETKTIDPVKMVSEWEKALIYQIGSERYPTVTPETAKHQLYGFKMGLKNIGLLDADDCFVSPDTFAFIRPVPEGNRVVGSNNEAMFLYLERQRDQAANNLFCYSANYLMTEPKSGYETAWQDAKRDCELVEELLRRIGGKKGEGPPDEQTAPGSDNSPYYPGKSGSNGYLSERFLTRQRE
jgi:hypothetical protein